MSSYKPKMFRSQDGCCICRAKSSSSRFTDSDKYAESFLGCFKIDDVQDRNGDICNACVLIVKRWKKLPVNSTKDWSHVVDARCGPGSKTVVRPKRREEELGENLKYKHVYRRKNVLGKVPKRNRVNSEGSSRSGSPSVPETNRSETETVLNNQNSLYPDFLDSTYWKRSVVCCGVIFVGQLGEVMLDKRFYKCCSDKKHDMIKTGEDVNDTEVFNDNVDSDSCETYDPDSGGDFYKEDTKNSPVNESHLPAFDQLDTNLETFSKCV